MNGKGARDETGPVAVRTAEDDLSGRLQRLGAELDAGRTASKSGSVSAGAKSDPHALSAALRASSEFVAGIVVGGGLGWAFDKVVGTTPWGLIVFLLLGFAAGVYNVLRAAGLPVGTSQVGPRGDK